MGLIEDLHAAVADPPAPEFDLDHLVQRGRRRRTTSRTLVGLAACAAVGLIMGGTYVATASRPSGGRTQPVAVAPPLVAPTPRTATPAAPTTEERLNTALALLPKSLHAPADGTVQFTRMASDHPAPDWFTAGWSYHGIGYSIEIFDEPMPGGNACAPSNRGADGCWERTVDAHGVTYVKSDATAYRKASVIYVDSFRPDHTHVTINENAINHHILPATDKAVLIAASHLTALSLHP
jgi:hypothetical protein